MLALVHAALLTLALAAVARAESPREGARRTFVDFRVGATGDDLGARDELCLEVAPLAAWSIEGCGNGSGFLHDDPTPTLSHFRAKLRVASVAARGVILEPQLALGFAELQVAEDSPGFAFAGTDASGASTAGPEAGLWLRVRLPLERGFEGVGAVGVSVAWLEHAGELARPEARLQPSIAASFGVGF